MSVSKKIISIIVAGGVLVSSIVTYVVWNATRDSVIEEARQKGDVVVREITRSIQQSLEDVIATTEIFAHVDDLEGYTVELPSSIASVHIVDANGSSVARYPDVPKDTDLEIAAYERQLATQASDTRTTVFGDVIADSDGKPVLMIATPVLNTKASTVVVAHVNWKHLMSALYRVDGYEVQLFSADHTLIAADTDESAFFSDTAYEELYPAQEVNTEGPAMITSLYADEPSSLARSPWIVVSSISREVVLRESVLETQRLVVFAGVLLAVCIVLIIQLLDIVIIRPLRELTEATVRTSEGNAQPFPLIHSGDEFGVLARSFQSMAENNRSVHSHLEQTVSTRTQELRLKIEELEKTQHTLQEEMAKDAALFSSITDGIIAIDAKGVVLKVNVAATQLLDAHDAVLIGREWADLVDVVYENKVVPARERPSTFALKGTVVTSTAYAMRLHNGTQFDVAFSTAPIFLHGKIIGAMIVFRDITMQKAVDRTKSEFVTLASHQLRTPLSAVNWNTEILLSGDAGTLTTNQREYVKEVYGGVQRMIRLVNGLLQLSTFEMADTSAQRGDHRTSLGRLVTQLLSEQESAIADKKLHITVKKSKSLPDAVGEKMLLSIVLQTIIDNACKYSKEGSTIGIRLSLVPAGELLHDRPAKEPMVLCEVADTGYGIPVAERARIFTKFYRASNIKEYSADGNGISLYLSKGIVDRLSGKMWFESEEGKGTTFSVAFLAASPKK